jgi:hypothetical protein
MHRDPPLTAAQKAQIDRAMGLEAHPPADARGMVIDARGRVSFTHIAAPPVVHSAAIVLKRAK